MTPAITDIRRSLSDCRICFDRLADVHPADGETLARNTMFAEFVVEWQGRRWLLCTPINQRGVDAVGAMAHMAAGLRAVRPRHLAEYRVFRSELSFTDSAGAMHRSDVVMQLLPDGITLDRVAAVSSHARILEELDDMQAEFARIGFSHNNLKPENIVVTHDERLLAVRCHFARMGGAEGAASGDGKAFEALRNFVMSKPETDKNCCVDALPKSLDGFDVIGGESEQRVLIRRDGLYGYADPHGEIVIEPGFDMAEPFREGRAEVDVEGRRGLIDKFGRWVIQPRYERLDYYDGGGLTLVFADGEWSAVDYSGNPTGISHCKVSEVCRMVKERMNITIEI